MNAAEVMIKSKAFKPIQKSEEICQAKEKSTLNTKTTVRKLSSSIEAKFSVNQSNQKVSNINNSNNKSK